MGLQRRLKVVGGEAVYHCVSRSNGGLFLFEGVDQERLRQILWRAAEFCGVTILAYTILSNHFHVLVRIPPPTGEPLPDEEILRRIGVMFGRRRQARVAELFAQFPSRDLRVRYTLRMNDVSHFLKLVKQSFSIWFNEKHDRFGTLWAERFSSTLIEPTPAILQTVAAYIDLNPVRAGLCQDPKDYRFCSYGEAVGGHLMARRGIQEAVGIANWQEASAAYRLLLFGKGELPTSRRGRPQAAFERQQVLEALNNGGKIPLAELLRCRVRYMTDGFILGSQTFVEGMFQTHRDWFGAKRKTASRRMRGGTAWKDLRAARNLQRDPIC